MANQDDGQPKNYHERIQLQNYKFRMFRRHGWTLSWDKQYIKDNRQYWSQVQVPRVGPPPIFNEVPDAWKKRRYHNPSAISSSKPDIENPQHDHNANANMARDALANAKYYFGSTLLRYQKVLGYGGLGLALHYRYDGQANPKDIAIKLSLGSWESDDLRQEGKAMEAMMGAVHLVQIIPPEDVGRPPLPRFYPRPMSDDSSEEEDSSGDESISQPHRPPRISRHLRPEAELRARIQGHTDRYRTWYYRNATLDSRKDFLLLEYIEGGDLRMLINKISEATTSIGGVTPIPNRVLWALWLCLVRGCVGMKYPPRKFHPERFARKDLIEDAPPARKRWRAKNWVHFDIDPTNIFVGNIERPELDEPESPAEEGSSSGEGYTPRNAPTATLSYFSGVLRQLNVRITRGEPSTGQGPDKGPLKRPYDVYHRDRADGEHLFIPKLKLADFGLTEQIKPYKRNVYYMRRRAVGKGSFLSPEQFSADWETIPADVNGAEAGENVVAGSYGSATNVWGIALTMWIIITQKLPPVPPQPQIPPGVFVPGGKRATNIDDIIREINPNLPISYCTLLMDGTFNHVDEDLRKTLYQCMYHNPTYRPTVEELLVQARAGVQKDFPNETDAVVNNWVNRFVLSAPTT